MAQASDCFNSQSDAAHTNANADMSSGCFSKEIDSELKVVLQAVLENQSNILTNQIASRIDELEKKMHICWSGLQKQMEDQHQKSTRQDERFERFESALATQSDSILDVAKELSALRGDIRAVSKSSYVPDEADNDEIHDEELHEFVEQEGAFVEAWEARSVDEDLFSTDQRSSSQENGQVLPFPAKLFAHLGDITSTPPSLEQMLSLPHCSEGAISNCDVEAVLNQNLRCQIPDESTEWSLWSTEPKEQLSLANEGGSTQSQNPFTSQTPFYDSSRLQGASESSSMMRYSGGRSSDRNLRIGVDDVRTVMIKNIPCRYSNQDMLDVFAELGFGNETIFFHLPSRYKQDSNLGYAFVGFNNKDITARFAEAMTGYRFKHSSSRKTCVVTPAHIQGMRKNVNHFSQGRKYNPPRLSM